MKKDKQKTDVVFRKFQEGDIIAIFPKEIYNEVIYGKNRVLSYQHIGQHGGCNTVLITELQKATKREYSDLKKELESIGYNLRVKN